MDDAASLVSELSDVQRTILGHIADGSSDGAIAASLGMDLRDLNRELKGLYISLDISQLPMKNRTARAGGMYRRWLSNGSPQAVSLNNGAHQDAEHDETIIEEAPVAVKPATNGYADPHLDDVPKVVEESPDAVSVTIKVEDTGLFRQLPVSVTLGTPDGDAKYVSYTKNGYVAVSYTHVHSFAENKTVTVVMLVRRPQ